MKEVIKINESTLKQIVAESVKKILKEDFDEFKAHGYKTDSNWGGTEVQISDSGDSVRFRDNHGTPGKPTDWFEIQFDENGVAYVETPNGTERLDEYMRTNL